MVCNIRCFRRVRRNGGGKVVTKKELKAIETLERRAAEKLEESERIFGKMNTVTISDRAYLIGIRAVLETLKEGKS